MQEHTGSALVSPHTGRRPQRQNAATGIFHVVFIHFIWTHHTRFDWCVGRLCVKMANRVLVLACLLVLLVNTTTARHATSSVSRRQSYDYDFFTDARGDSCRKTVEQEKFQKNRRSPVKSGDLATLHAV
ncbi:hypothetical protein evm_009540 [Chilo suppressalis]|nr:hypothetical protein evm_009540 [Chilo suppressalis]